jgi:serine/threonine protein kinase
VSPTGLIIGLSIGSGAMLIFLVMVTTLIIHKIKTQRKEKMRQRFFNQNHGQLLQQLLPQRAGITERMIVITLEELEKATNNFDKARELGGGGHGTVYKGILSSLHVVAIKKSKIVIQREIDEFINEVVILSQINHRNIVKLQGCCLETEVPLLVYEFISNGTLYNHLHVRTSTSLPWRDRLRIAVETARALAYLHSLTSTPIIHRDVKSPNILLDDNLTVKLSDFGASRYIPIDQSGLITTVQGTYGYLDPMYHSTGHLTEKSDVYNFGVLLIELLTRNKPVSYRSIEGHGLVYHFVTLVSKGSLFRILDPQVVKEGDGEVVDIALLAAICVKHKSKDRPTMRQVEMTLESIYAAKEYVSCDMTDDQWSEEITNVDARID